MTRYFKVENGSITNTNLPKVDKLKDGRTVSGFDKLPADILKAEDWLPVVDNGMPTYDPSTQTVTTDYVVGMDQVTTQYTIEELPPPPPPPPDYTQEFVDAVNASTTLDQLKAALIGNAGPGAQARQHAKSLN